MTRLFVAAASAFSMGASVSGPRRARTTSAIAAATLGVLDMQGEKTLPGLALVAIRVTSLEESRTFYGRLGFAFETHQHGSGPVHYAAIAHGYVLELYPGRTLRADEEWLFRVGFAVPSLEAVLVEVSPECVLVQPKPSPWGRRMVLLDPDRNRVELTESTLQA